MKSSYLPDEAISPPVKLILNGAPVAARIW
jgi:hypothetical protein